jgi:enediyne biosynthesis protein E4
LKSQNGRRKARAARLAFFVFLALASACGTKKSGPDRAAEAPGTSQDWFTDRAKESGLDFIHFNGMSGEFYYPEIMPPGVALFDYDNDGDLDVFVVQDQMLGRKPLSAAKPQPVGPLNSHLFRNDLTVATDGTRTLRFTDVTAASGIVTHGYAMGVATGDFNNDGCIDLYVTALGPNQLFRNNCDGTFTDVSKQSGTDDPGWSISATFFDYDRDGWLDLFVGNYLQYNIEANIHCFSLSGSVDYCPPQQPRRHVH